LIDDKSLRVLNRLLGDVEPAVPLTVEICDEVPTSPQCPAADIQQPVSWPQALADEELQLEPAESVPHATDSLVRILLHAFVGDPAVRRDVRLRRTRGVLRRSTVIHRVHL